VKVVVRGRREWCRYRAIHDCTCVPVLPSTSTCATSGHDARNRTAQSNGAGQKTGRPSTQVIEITRRL
jgi:hypothetical protein